MTFSLPRRSPIDALDIDQAAVRAWPAQDQERIGPWLARANHGFTRRANSVAVLGEVPAAELEDAVERAERFYRQRSLPARFQLRAHADHDRLRDVLGRRGFQAEEGVDVVVRAAPLRSLRAAAPSDRHGRVLIADAPSENWIDVWWASRSDPGVQRDQAVELLWQVKGRCGFASHVLDGELVATGLGIVDGAWLGIFCVATREDRRHQGSARRILGALSTWGVAHAARDGYLPQRVTNPAAASAERFGLLPVYRFGYLLRDA